MHRLFLQPSTVLGHRSLVNGLVALVLLLGTNQSFAQARLDLPGAINYALSQNRQLVRSALSIDSSGLRGADARTEFQPSIRPDLTARVSGGQRSFGYGLRASKKLISGTELSASSRLLSNPDAPGGVLHEGSIRLEIQQPLFRNFGSLIHGEALVQASNALKSAQRRFLLQKADLVVEVVQTYEKILRLKQQVRSDQQSFKRMDALYRVTKEKELLGRTTRIDTLRVGLLRGQALARLEANQERIAATERDFAELLGFSPDTVFELQPTLLLEFELPQPEEAVRIALENRLDYAEVLQDHGDALRGVRIARRRLLPDVKVSAGHEWLGAGPATLDAIRLDENVWFIRITLETDLNLARERIALGQAKITQTSALQTIELVELSIARQVQQHLLAYRRAQAELKIADRNLDLAARRAKLARRLFALGRADNFSVTDAEVAYLQADNRLLSTRTEASISGYRLSRVLGTLVETPEPLRPPPVNGKQ